MATTEEGMRRNPLAHSHASVTNDSAALLKVSYWLTRQTAGGTAQEMGKCE